MKSSLGATLSWLEIPVLGRHESALSSSEPLGRVSLHGIPYFLVDTNQLCVETPAKSEISQVIALHVKTETR